MMNQAFNPVFAFKNILGDENAKHVISGLICHPIIWELLSIEKYFLSVTSLFGKDLGNWTTKNIISNVDNLIDHNISISTTSENKKYQTLRKELLAISKTIQELNEKRNNNETWVKIIQDIQLETDNKLEITRKWGTVFSCFLTENNERIDLEDSLIESSDKNILIATLLNLYKNQTWISGFLLRNIEIFINNPHILKKLVFDLVKIGGKNAAHQLVKETLNHAKFSHEILKSDDYCLTLETIPEKIEKLGEFRILSSFIKDEEKSQILKSLAEALFEKSLNLNPVKLYSQDSHLDLDELLSLDTYYSYNDQRSYVAYVNNSEILEEIFLALEISASDVTASREICKHFILKVKESGLNSIIFSQEFGWFIDPIDIAKLLINVGLEIEAILLLTKEAESQPKNTNNKIFLAHYSNILGDHNRALKYYSILQILGINSREEKILFCKSLKYLGMWPEVLSVRNTINPLNVNDDLETAIAAYSAKNFDVLENFIKHIISKYPKNKIAKTLDLLLLNSNQENNVFENQFEILIKDPNIDIRAIIFIEEYLREKGDFKKIKYLVDELPGKYKNHPEIQLINYKTQKKLGDTNACNLILGDLSGSETINKQEVLEEIITELLENGLFDEMKNLLRIYQGKWKLSPVINYAKAQILLGDKDFLGAKKQISYLIEDGQINEKTVSMFGCSLLETTLSDFPYRKPIHEISVNEKIIFQELFNQLPDQSSNLTNNLLQIEIYENEKEPLYIKLLTNNTFIGSSEYWRIPFGLGILYFQRKQFDQAIIYFKEAQKIMPSNPIMLDLLIQSYGQLKLPGEAIKVIEVQKKANNLSLVDLIKYSDFLFEYIDFMKFLEYSETEDSSTLKYSIALARVFIKNGDLKMADFHLSRMESGKNLTENFMLALAQCYLDCGNEISSRRVLEKYLALKSVINASSVLEAVSIYYQLKEYKKAQNLLNSVKDFRHQKSLISVDILIKQNKIELASNLIETLLSTEEENRLDQKLLKSSLVKIPSNWMLDLPNMYSLATSLRLRTKNYEKAFELIITGMQKFPNQQDLQDSAFKISYFVKNSSFNKKYLEEHCEGNFEPNKEMVPILAEAALENGQEILAARILSESGIDDENNKHFLSIQTRLLFRNGREQEANDIFQTMLAKNLPSDLPDEIHYSNDITKLNNQLALCETAYEIGDLQIALEISRNIFSKLGSISRNMDIYLRTLTNMLERNRLFAKLMIKNNIFRITEDDLYVLDSIINKSRSEANNSYEWMIRAESVINRSDNMIQKIAELPPTPENISSIVYSLMELGRETEAENTIKLIDKNENALFSFALQKLEEDPEKAQSIIHKILQNGNSRPEYYAALSLAYEKLEKYSDSYSAICLALEIWPNEYEWENFAGQLCKKLGNNLSAFSHFRNAETFNEVSDYSSQLMDTSVEKIYLLNKNERDGKLTNTAKDIPLLYKIINFLINEDRLNEIDPYFEKLRNFDTKSVEIGIIAAKIAFKNEKYDEAMEEIDPILQINPSHLEGIKIKTKIIAEQNGTQSAILFLDSIDIGLINNPEDLIILKAEFLQQLSGIGTAINYLTNKIKEINENINVVIYTAQLFLLNGNPKEALSLSEEALSANSENSELLSLLSNVSKELGDLDKAVDYMIRSITIDPFQAQNYILLSNLFEARRDHKGAIDILNEGLAILPNDYSLLRYIGLLLYKQGKYKEAHLDLIKAYKINSMDSDLEQIIRILENTLKIKMESISKK